MKQPTPLISTALSLLLSFTASAQDYHIAKGQIKTSQIVEKTGYTAAFSPSLHIPRWVGWELTDREAAATDQARTDQFHQDTNVNGCPEPTAYSHSGYDRGYMAPAADMKWSHAAMEDSFCMVNICPQDHNLNAGLWADLERQCRVWAKHYGKLWITCGPITKPSDKRLPSRVDVPTAFYKCLLKQFKGRWYAIAFVMPNKPATGKISAFTTSVDRVEELTGLDFFSALPDDVENQIESVCNWDDWKYYSF